MNDSDLPIGLARYARRFHQVAGTGHHVASPLGAWLLLALAGPACAGDDLRELEEILGADADTAAAFAPDLLASPHPLVHPVARRSLFDLPLGEAPAWAIREESAQVTDPEDAAAEPGSVTPGG